MSALSISTVIAVTVLNYISINLSFRSVERNNQISREMMSFSVLSPFSRIRETVLNLFTLSGEEARRG